MAPMDSATDSNVIVSFQILMAVKIVTKSLKVAIMEQALQQVSEYKIIT
jgi:hypothetical protein